MTKYGTALPMLIAASLAFSGCAIASEQPTAEETLKFLRAAEQELAAAAQFAELNDWVYMNFITDDTARLSTVAGKTYKETEVRLAGEAVRFTDVEGLDEETRRKLHILRARIVVPAPSDPEKLAEQASIGASMSGMYGKGEYCDESGACRDLQKLNDIMDQSRDADELLEAWNGWRTVAPPMRDLYARQVELANEGAQELGFADLGTMWRANYDMPPEDFPGELNRLFGQLKPLYEALHCHVRARLGEHYGTDLVPQDGPIPAHLLGNMWAQEWGNIYDLVAPEGEVSSHDLGAILLEKGYDALKMVQTAEDFFISLGFEKLPASFWERSLFTQPADRNVVCHASAWNLDEVEDLRIKMCIKINAEDFSTVHHELGHNYYYRAYNDKSFLHRNGANDGFHEAVGDTLNLAITPAYLQKIGLLEDVPGASGDLALLLRRGMDSIAFLPFGLMIDLWRWKVFAGEVGPDGYNELWWQLREEYQGVAAPIERPADAFDPGAKYHVPHNMPYTRYFLARVLQFQFHRALCEISGFEGPIHRCTFHGDKQAGQALNAMLRMGRSRPWPEALEALTGSGKMDTTAMLDYFAPLKEWLDRQNEGRACGW